MVNQPKVSTGISLPEQTMAEIDVLAAEWFTTRSSAIHRLLQEYKRLSGWEPAPEHLDEALQKWSAAA